MVWAHWPSVYRGWQFVYLCNLHQSRRTHSRRSCLIGMYFPATLAGFS